MSSCFNPSNCCRCLPHLRRLNRPHDRHDKYSVSRRFEMLYHAISTRCYCDWFRNSQPLLPRNQFPEHAVEPNETKRELLKNPFAPKKPWAAELANTSMRRRHLIRQSGVPLFLLLENISNLIAMAPTLVTMASNLIAMASTLVAMASNQIMSMASSLVAMASNLITIAVRSGKGNV